VARAILKGEKETGVAIIKVVKKMDAGPILGLRRAPIPPEATTPEMEEKLSEEGADLLLDVIGQVSRGEAKEKRQNERQATYARKFERRDGRMDWRKSVKRITDFVRALQPFPGAFTFLNRKRLGVHKITGERPERRPKERPGTIVAVEKDHIRVCCGDGYIDIHELQPESRKKMTAEEFIQGADIKVGDRIG
jgi:methionyl-tRNA formyltransferase